MWTICTCDDVELVAFSFDLYDTDEMGTLNHRKFRQALEDMDAGPLAIGGETVLLRTGDAASHVRRYGIYHIMGQLLPPVNPLRPSHKIDRNAFNVIALDNPVVLALGAAFRRNLREATFGKAYVHCICRVHAKIHMHGMERFYGGWPHVFQKYYLH